MRRDDRRIVPEPLRIRARVVVTASRIGCGAEALPDGR